MTVRASPVLLASALLVCATRASAGDDTMQSCIDANAQAQNAQKAGQLRKAKASLVACARDACPAVVRADCAHMLVDVTASVPTVVVDARDASGAETTQVRMRFDGMVVAENLTGLEVELDPGAHQLRFELPDGSSREQAVVLEEGEKRRRVVVDFSEGARGGGTANGHAAPETPAPAPRRSVLPWVFGGVAVAGAAAFGGFAIAGYVQERNLASSCAPACTKDQVNQVRTSYVISDVGLGVAAVGLGGALLTLWLDHGKSAPSTAWRLDVRPLPGGGDVAATLRW